GRRPGEADRTGLREKCQIESGEVTVADENLAAVGHRLPVDLVQNAVQAVAAAGRHDDLMLLFEGAMHGGDTLFVGTGEALMHLQCTAVHGRTKAEFLQPLSRQVECGRIGNGAGWREQIDPLGVAMAVLALRILRGRVMRAAGVRIVFRHIGMQWNLRSARWARGQLEWSDESCGTTCGCRPACMASRRA